jgi:O-antigen ligase
MTTDHGRQTRDYRPPSIVHARLFALIDFALVALAGALWYNWPGLGGWPLLIALLPWAARLLSGQHPFRRTRFDLLVLLFLLTAFLGIWTGYDRAAAWAKFWLILDGALLYYALAGQPEENRWLVSGLSGLFGAGVAGYFLLVNDWNAHPAKLAALNQIGLQWMAVRPTLSTHPLHPNVAAGISALAAPLTLAAGLRAWQKKRSGRAVAAGLALALSLAGILLGTSRGALLALAAALGVWALWALSGWAAKFFGTQRNTEKHGEDAFEYSPQPASNRAQTAIFSFTLLLILAGGIILVAAYPGGLIALANKLPGPANAGSRMDLIWANLSLIADFPFTGGGLDAFPGLYSHYSMVSPFFLLDHGHNLFLDVALEQGLLGGALLVILFLSTGWSGLRLASTHGDAPVADRLLPWAALASLLVLALHGLVDDVLYGSRGSLLLLLPAGLLAMLTAQPRPSRGLPSQRRLLTGVLAVLILSGLALGFRIPLSASLQANLAALQMAKIELADFAGGQWDTGQNLPALLPLAGRFEQALALDPRNATAHHRLGLIAMQQRDFPAAIGHLQTAWQQRPHQRGLQKNLGYSTAWDGRYEQAAALLEGIPEAAAEMQVYTWWWEAQGRPDLAGHATNMATRLNP